MEGPLSRSPSGFEAPLRRPFVGQIEGLFGDGAGGLFDVGVVLVLKKLSGGEEVRLTEGLAHPRAQGEYVAEVDARRGDLVLGLLRGLLGLCGFRYRGALLRSGPFPGLAPGGGFFRRRLPLPAGLLLPAAPGSGEQGHRSESSPTLPLPGSKQTAAIASSRNRNCYYKPG